MKKQDILLRFMTSATEKDADRIPGYHPDEGEILLRCSGGTSEYEIFGCFAAHRSTPFPEKKRAPKNWDSWAVTYVPTGLVLLYCAKLKDARTTAKMLNTAYHTNQHFQSFNDSMHSRNLLGVRVLKRLTSAGFSGIRELIWVACEQFFMCGIDDIPWINEDLADPFA